MYLVFTLVVSYSISYLGLEELPAVSFFGWGAEGFASVNLA